MLKEKKKYKVICHNLQKRSATRPSLVKICPCGSGKLYQKCCGVSGGHGPLKREDGISYCLDSHNTMAIEIIPIDEK